MAVQLSNLLVQSDPSVALRLLQQCILSLQNICDNNKGYLQTKKQDHQSMTVDVSHAQSNSADISLKVVSLKVRKPCTFVNENYLPTYLFLHIVIKYRFCTYK
jgi:hypothetical protein